MGMRSGIAQVLCRAAGRVPWPLVVVVLLEVVLLAGVARAGWLQSKHAPRDKPQLRAGYGVFILGDGLGYYAWLRSMMIDGDWQFDNEFDDYNPLHHGTPPRYHRTDAGYRANQWSMGPACVWATTVVPGHLVMRALEGRGWPWPADGYSFPYQVLVGATTALVSFLGLGFMYAICLRFARPSQAALAAGFLTLGSSMVVYNTIQPSMGHGIATALLAGLVWYWLKTYGSLQKRRWFLLGLGVGLVMLMRWQLVTYASLPAAEGALAAAAAWRSRPRRLPWQLLVGLALAALGAFLGCLPQMVGWRVVYGHWVAYPIPVTPHWLAPSWADLLVSRNRSLFYWTPLTLLACVGYPVYWLWGRRPGATTPAVPPPGGDHTPLVLLVGSFLVQLYVLACLWGPTVYLGPGAFGLRQLTESLVLLAPGLALLLELAPPRRYGLLCAAASVLVLWNFALIWEKRAGLLTGYYQADFSTLVRNLFHLPYSAKYLLIPAAILLLPLGAWVQDRAGKRPGLAGDQDERRLRCAA
jgi:hypothetical protein